MAMDAKLKKKIDAAKKLWKGARDTAAAGGDFTELPDGRYLARLTKAEVTESKSSGRLQVAWTYKIAEGEYEGDTKMDFDGIETADNLTFLARKLRRFGFTSLPDDLEEVIQLLEELGKRKPLCKISLKTRGEFQNVYVDKAIDADDEDEALEDASADADEAEDEDEESEDEAEDDAEGEDEDEESEEDEEAEEDEDAEESDEVELKVGMVVSFTTKDGRKSGKVIEILEAEEKVRVKTGDGKINRVAIDALEFDEGEETEDEAEDVPDEPPVKKAAKKAAPAPTKKRR